ncbi:MAG TPA: hypothetical protein VM324_01840 [Egibacteraceae bacterium]|jgi:hypothetical protein|nr:hypothetical protein [Egibacteraceae bacterium]
MDEAELRDRVRDLRAQGYSPKAIARALGVRPARAAALVRAAAREQAAASPDASVVGCWVSPGWSAGLAVPEQRGWPDRPGSLGDELGVANVLVARERRSGGGMSVCGYLVDTFCLGVKNALGPWTMDRAELRRFVACFFDAFDADPVDAPVELARHLVWGAVEYARGLGFAPHPDFGPAAGHLGALDAPSAIGFGRHGRPFFMQGPYDDADRVLRTLREHVGEDFEFVVELDPRDAVGVSS